MADPRASTGALVDSHANADTSRLGRPRARHRVRNERDVLRWAAIMLVVGALVGMLVHVLDSAPEALAFTATAARVALALVAVLGFIFGVARLVMLGEAPLLAGVAALLVGAFAAYPFGPTWIPAATVSGTYTLSMPGMPTTHGLLTCEWLPGRWRVGTFAATTPVAAPNGDELLLSASFTLPEVRLDRVASDGSPRASYANGTQNVLEPGRLPDGQPAGAADGSAGQDEVPVALEASHAPVGAPASWGERLPADAGQGFVVDLTWQCARP